MTKPRLAVDTNLLLLYIIGAVDQAQIGHHKRLSAYTLEDFLTLTDYVAGRRLVTIPNILTETSNLMGQGLHGDILKEARIGLAQIVKQLEEIFVPSVKAVALDEFHWLGLTDCAAISIDGNDFEFLTDDLNLYGAALGRNIVATNFNHLRDPLL